MLPTPDSRGVGAVRRGAFPNGGNAIHHLVGSAKKRMIGLFRISRCCAHYRGFTLRHSIRILGLARIQRLLKGGTRPVSL